MGHAFAPGDLICQKNRRRTGKIDYVGVVVQIHDDDTFWRLRVMWVDLVTNELFFGADSGHSLEHL